MQAPFSELAEEDGILRRTVLINALIDLGRVERVPSENFLPNRPSDNELHTKSQKASLSDLPKTEEAFSPSPELRNRLIPLTNRHCLFCAFEPIY